jgi:zinc protease
MNSITAHLGALLLFGSALACSSAPPPPPKAAPAATALDQSFRAQVPPAAKAVELVRPEPASLQLGNGFSVWALTAPTGTLSLRVTCRIGARDNPVGKSGLAALTTRLLTEGTEHKSALELAVASESLGTSLSEASGRNASSIELEVLPRDEEQAIALLAEVIRKPAFLEKDLVRVRSEWLDDLVSQREDPGQLSWLVGYRALLGPRWGIAPNGTPADVKKLSIKDLRTFWAAHFRPERCALLAVGPISVNSIEGIAATHFGGWRPGKSAQSEPLPPISAPARTSLYIFDRPGAVQTALFVAGSAPSAHAEGHEARMVLNNLFGGLFTSRLNQNLREKNAYTYGAFSTFVGTRDWGLWAASTSVRSDVTKPALTELLAEWQGLLAAGTLQDAEIARARSDLVFRTSAHLEHTSSLLGELEEIFVNELAASYYSELPATLQGVNQDQVRKQLRYVPAQSAVIAVVGDQTQIGDLSGFSETRRAVGLQWLDGNE